MGITNSNKEVSTSQINCGEAFTVTLSLAAAPDISSNPTDIVLILDRSGSMAGSPLANLKSGAKKFIEILDESTDGGQDGQIGGGSHIAIVSFADTAVQDTPLTTSVTALNTAVDALSSGGRTNHADAFTKAAALFDPSSSNARVIVMFTDGVTTVGENPAPVAAEARAQGIVIYVIGLSGNGGIDEAALEDWASKPASSYVAITPDDAELEDLFEALAKNISKPGATNIVINEVLNPCFRITALSTPTKGTASVLTDTTLQWKIDKLGVQGTEAAELTFTVQHSGSCSGTLKINDEIIYEDSEGNSVSFPSPEIHVDCGTTIIPESCPDPVSVTIGGCEDAIEYDAGDIALESTGRILQLDATLKNICPARRVALAVILSEVDAYGEEHKRGLKTFVVPAHYQSSCRDVTLRCIKFVLPESLDVSGSGGTGICNERKFRARFIAHYIDHEFECCTIR